VRNYALASLEQAGPEVVLALPQLAAALKNPDAEVRAWVAKLIGLGGERAKGATDALIERLADPSVDVRVWSAFALRSIGAPAATAIPRLVKSLGEDPESKMRVEAARALAAFGPLAGAAVDALVAACRDPDVDVRLWSLFALGELKVKSDAVVAALKQAATSSDERVLAEANKALEKLGEEHDAKAVANAPGAPADLPALMAPITYQGFALVLVDGGGAAVVTFFDETHESSKSGGRDGVKYRYRYLAKGQAEPTTGEGESFSILRNTDSALRVEDYAASHSYIDAGPLRVGWSHRGSGSAFVYWKPEALTVTIASAIDFETLDLRRFLR
jgi:HEAT repeat protein